MTYAYINSKYLGPEHSYSSSVVQDKPSMVSKVQLDILYSLLHAGDQI